MVAVPFNPFGKSLEQLTSKDLALLRDVAEGWYVEYKGEVVPARSIAKSLAAFANHYGGWIFYGVKSDHTSNNKAVGFPGIDKNAVSLFIDQVREAARNGINPPPYYEYKVINGPCPDIGLSDEKAIVIALVPMGTNAPYIHFDGRIYRRVADASDPKAETDRFTLDHLWSRGQQARNKLSSFLNQEPILPLRSEEMSYMNLFFMPDPLGVVNRSVDLSFERFVELMSDKTRFTYSIGFDNFFPMVNGFVARSVHGMNPLGLAATWRFFSDGSSFVSTAIPGIYGHMGSNFVTEIKRKLRNYQLISRFVDILVSTNLIECFLLDCSIMPLVLFATVATQQVLMREVGISGPFYAKAALCSVAGRIPYLDTETYIKFIQEHGLPVIQSDRIFAPPDDTFESLVLIQKEDIDSDDFLLAAALLPLIVNAFGLPKSVAFSEDGEWMNAANRAAEVLRNTNR
jgi:hypothetical protein